MEGNNMFLGGHVEGGMGLMSGLERMKSRGFNALQCFVVDPYKYFMDKDKLEVWRSTVAILFRAEKQQNKFFVSVHGNYISNFAYAGPGKNTYKVSISSLIHIYRCAEELGADVVVFHVGSHKEASREEAVQRVKNAIIEVFQRAGIRESAPMLLMESAACGGTQVADPDFMVEVINSLPTTIQPKVGFCLDTAHTYAAGVNFEDLGITKMFIEKYGKYIKLVHQNNPEPNVVCGKHLDRHKSPWPLAKFHPTHMLDMVNAFSSYPQIFELSVDEGYDFAANFLAEKKILVKEKNLTVLV